jgi:hypothetical protein
MQMIQKMKEESEIIPGFLDYVVDGVDWPELTSRKMNCAYGPFATDEDARPLYQRRIVYSDPAIGSINVDISRLPIFLSEGFAIC